MKGPLKEGLGFYFFPLAFALGSFWRLWLLHWAFWYGKFLEGKRITEGKRIAGKLLKGKEWLKRD
jgi:hypothetical protein